MSEMSRQPYPVHCTVRSRTEKPIDYPIRFPVPDEFADWSVPYPEYAPVFYDAPRAETTSAKNGDFADPRDATSINWNNRYSLSGPLVFDPDGKVRNPVCRTGIEGRGKLNAFGPTIAVDIVLLRIRSNGDKQVLIITRNDNGKQGLPAGKLAVNDHNEIIEAVTVGARRELFEETGLDMNLENASEVCSGYVDDERNTDRAWMESICLAGTISEERAAGMILNAKENDTKFPKWADPTEELYSCLNAENGKMIRLALTKFDSPTR